MAEKLGDYYTEVKLIIELIYLITCKKKLLKFIIQ